MILRTSLREAVRVKDGVVLVPSSSNAVVLDEAAKVLARLPKPVVCTGSIGIEGTLTVECPPIRTVEEDGRHRAAINGFSYQFPANERPDEDRFLLVHGPGGSLKLSLTAFRRWYQDYLPSLSVILGTYPTSADSAAGDEVEAVIRLLHVEPITPGDIPDELRFLRPG